MPLALVVANFVYQPDPRIGLKIGGILGLSLGSQRSWLGIAFWTGLTLIASALPVRLPYGHAAGCRDGARSRAITLGGPAVGGWCPALGSTMVREIRGRSLGTAPWQITPGLSAAGHRGWSSATRGPLRSLRSSRIHVLDFLARWLQRLCFLS